MEWLSHRGLFSHVFGSVILPAIWLITQWGSCRKEFASADCQDIELTCKHLNLWLWWSRLTRSTWLPFLTLTSQLAQVSISTTNPSDNPSPSICLRAPVWPALLLTVLVPIYIFEVGDHLVISPKSCKISDVSNSILFPDFIGSGFNCWCFHSDILSGVLLSLGSWVYF